MLGLAVVFLELDFVLLYAELANGRIKKKGRRLSSLTQQEMEHRSDLTVRNP